MIRTPIGNAPRGMFKNTHPDDLLVRAMQSAVTQVPCIDLKLIQDAISGCSFPEGAQGLNIARNALLLAGLRNAIGGVTINRYCASGITSMTMAADRIRVGEAGVMIAGGAESMSMVPIMGFHPSINMNASKDENVDMGLTACRKSRSAMEGLARIARHVRGRVVPPRHRRPDQPEPPPALLTASSRVWKPWAS